MKGFGLLGIFLVSLCLIMNLTGRCEAHFGTVIPSDDIVTKEDSKKLVLDIKFIHPMEDLYMEMAKPKKVAVFQDGQVQILTDQIKARKGKGKSQKEEFTYWYLEYNLKKPGDYIFFVEPDPYWEPSEEKYIVHYAKVIVNALGKEEGWDKPINLPIEIIPLTRPYGLWTGNVFQGQVLVNGKPAPFTEVEVEYLSSSSENKGKVNIPADPYITQVIKTDSNGVFTYAMPKAGWWGFAALSEGPEKIKHDGQEKDVEIGGIIWVHVVDMAQTGGKKK